MRLTSYTQGDTAGDKSLKRFLQRPFYYAFLHAEKWLNLTFGATLNPLYHLGSLTLFFLWVVLVSGIYLYIFFDTGIQQTYDSIQYLTHDQWYAGGVMRSLHRYASDAAMITVILHIFREFALDRYRGFRWFSWFTGIPSLWLLVMLGITGYWLVWDQVALYVATGSAKLLDALPLIGGSMARNFLSDQINDRFFTLMTLLHLVGGPLTLIFGLWIHVKRISNVSPMGPHRLAYISLLGLLALALLKPAISHAPANMSVIPTALDIDWFYLNIFPLLQHWGPAATWSLIIGLTLLLAFAPWLPHKRTPAAAEVHLDRCNGCGQCLEDCPYDAVSLQQRSDGARWENEAVVNPDLCASCGICIGSCPYSNPFRKVDKQLRTGIDLPTNPVHQAHSATKAALATLHGPAAILIFSCDHGVNMADISVPETAVIQFSCTGMLPSGFVDYALKNGADGVLISGCQSSDCYYRYGNKWVEERLCRERMPKLRKSADRNRIDVQWASTVDKDNLLKQINAFRQILLRGQKQS